MTDYHVHIGQWYERYYSAREVFGTDFPITHYHAVKRGAKIDLAAQYAKDLDSIKGSGVKFSEIIRRGAAIL